MIETKKFGDEMKALGFDFYSGVPCSFLKALINYAINECDYVMAANEGDAVAIASGAKLGGKKSVVLMMQVPFPMSNTAASSFDSLPTSSDLNFTCSTSVCSILSNTSGAILHPHPAP